jgi:hypothetical protein
VADKHTSGTRAAAIMPLFVISFLLWLGLF